MRHIDKMIAAEGFLPKKPVKPLKEDNLIATIKRLQDWKPKPLKEIVGIDDAAMALVGAELVAPEVAGAAAEVGSGAAAATGDAVAAGGAGENATAAAGEATSAASTTTDTTAPASSTKGGLKASDYMNKVPNKSQSDSDKDKVSSDIPTGDTE